MNIEQAAHVHPGDLVTYQHARRRVIAVTRDGLWAPYFELDDEGVVSHRLVEAATSAQAQPREARRAAN